MTSDTFTFSDGEVFRTMLDALIYLKRNPALTVTCARGLDVTARFMRILTDHPYGTGK